MTTYYSQTNFSPKKQKPPVPIWRLAPPSHLFYILCKSLMITIKRSSLSRLDRAEPYGRSLLRRGGLSQHEAVARTLPRTCSGATASPPRGPSAGYGRPSRPFGLRSTNAERRKQKILLKTFGTTGCSIESVEHEKKIISVSVFSLNPLMKLL